MGRRGAKAGIQELAGGSLLHSVQVQLADDRSGSPCARRIVEIVKGFDRAKLRCRRNVHDAPVGALRVNPSVRRWPSGRPVSCSSFKLRRICREQVESRYSNETTNSSGSHPVRVLLQALREKGADRLFRTRARGGPGEDRVLVPRCLSRSGHSRGPLPVKGVHWRRVHGTEPRGQGVSRHSSPSGPKW